MLKYLYGNYLINDAEIFRIVYETLGNFMPLPCGRLTKAETCDRFFSLNLAKNDTYLDQFDLCLEEIKKFYDKKPLAYNAYANAIRNNSEYFYLFSDFRDFLEKNYLQAFVTDFDGGDYTIKKLFDREEGQVLPEKDTEILAYFEKSTKLIKTRAETMKEALKEILKEENQYKKD